MKVLTLILLLVTYGVSWGQNEIPVPDTLKHCFTDQEVVGIAKTFKKAEYLEQDNKDLTEENNTLRAKVAEQDNKFNKLAEKLADALNISELKEKMLRDCENKPAVIVNSTKWWVFAAIIISSSALGYLVGRLAK